MDNTNPIQPTTPTPTPAAPAMPEPVASETVAPASEPVAPVAEQPVAPAPEPTVAAPVAPAAPFNPAAAAAPSLETPVAPVSPVPEPVQTAPVAPGTPAVPETPTIDPSIINAAIAEGAQPNNPVAAPVADMTAPASEPATITDAPVTPAPETETPAADFTSPASEPEKTPNVSFNETISETPAPNVFNGAALPNGKKIPLQTILIAAGAVVILILAVLIGVFI
ncbi:hypothetical protein IJG10_02370 [Candidatus Saccharibacteria bacterium]|nr:hypothetical protein [Candidatus Saccharibacteria bacterium]